MNTLGKPGYKTTEFWLSAAAFAVGAVMSSGVFGEGSGIMQGLGLAATMLAAMGYTFSRNYTKANEARGAAIVEAAAFAKKSSSVKTTSSS